MKRLSPCKAMRAKCLDCCCGQIVEVRDCITKDCPLHPYRMGTRDADKTIAKRFNKDKQA